MVTVVHDILIDFGPVVIIALVVLAMSRDWTTLINRAKKRADEMEREERLWQLEANQRFHDLQAPRALRIEISNRNE